MSSILKVDSITDINGNAIISSDGSGNLTPNTFTALTVSGDLTVDTDTLKVDSANNRVGIGLTNPACQLDIREDGTGSLTKRVQANIDLSGSTNLLSTDPNLFVQQSGTGSAGLALKSGAVEFALRLDSSGEFIFDKETTERMRIDSSGNVGIGTSNPNAKLHIHGPDQTTANIDTSSNIVLNVAGTGASTNNGGSIVFSAADGAWKFAAIKGLVTDGGNNTKGDLAFSVRNVSTDSTLSEAMRIDSSGNVGIGTNSPSTALDVVGSVGASGAFSSDNGTTHTQISIAGTGEGVVGTASNHDLQIRVNASERMRIDTSGNVGINETSAEGRLHVAGSYTGTYGRAVGLFEDADLTGDTNNQILVLVFSGDNDAANATFVSFRDSGGEIGAINALSGGTTVQYITSSDYRLKENINYDFDATSRLKQLKPARFNFKTNTDRTLDGFLAHEVSDIVPEAVSGTKDETETKEKVVVNSSGQVIAENIEEADWENGKIADEDGNTKYPIDSTWEATKIVPVYQGIDQSKLVPLLTASLQEAIAKIEELETRLTALEA